MMLTFEGFTNFIQKGMYGVILNKKNGKGERIKIRKGKFVCRKNENYLRSNLINKHKKILTMRQIIIKNNLNER